MFLLKILSLVIKKIVNLQVINNITLKKIIIKTNLVVRQIYNKIKEIRIIILLTSFKVANMISIK
jgi:hypothetical protein